MKRWIIKKSEDGVNNKIDLFLKEIIKVYEKHGFSISHEDVHGAFVIEKYNEDNIEWLKFAHDGTNK